MSCTSFKKFLLEALTGLGLVPQGVLIKKREPQGPGIVLHFAWLPETVYFNHRLVEKKGTEKRYTSNHAAFFKKALKLNQAAAENGSFFRR